MATLQQQLCAPDEYIDTAILQILGNHHCFGFAENPNTGWRADFNVVPDQITEVRIPETEIAAFYVDSVQQTGIHIHTDSLVWAYLVTFEHQWKPNMEEVDRTRDVVAPSKTGLLPCNVLETGFSYSLSELHNIWVSEHYYGTSFIVVATENNTLVTVGGHYSDFAACAMEWANGNHMPTSERTYSLSAGEAIVIPFLFPPNLCSTSAAITIDTSRLCVTTNCKKIAVYSDIMHASQADTWQNNRIPYNSHLFGKEFVRRVAGACTDIVVADDVCAAGEAAFVVETGDDGMIEYEEGNSYVIDVPYDPTPCFYKTSVPVLPATYFVVSDAIGGFPSVPVELNAQFLSAGSDNLQVNEVIIPTFGNSEVSGDVDVVQLVVSVHPEGISTTYINDVQVPENEFELVPGCESRYFVLRKEFRDEGIPSQIKIANENGFSANLYEASSRHGKGAMNILNSGATFPSGPLRPSLDSAALCLRDTLRIHAENNCDQLPVGWLMNGEDYYPYQSDTLTLVPDAAGPLRVQMVVYGNCENDTTDIPVRVFSLPEIHLPADTTLCPGGSIALDMQNYTSLLWSDGTENQPLTPTAEGRYSVVASNACGTDSCAVEVRLYEPLAVELGSDTNLCALATLLLDATQPHPASYLWQDSTTNATYTVFSDGEYWVVVTDRCAGTSDTINVAYLTDFEVNIGGDTVICAGSELLLDAYTPHCSYLWHDGSTAATLTVTQSGDYSVRVFNACADAEASIHVEVEDCALELYIPSAFTPDGDGSNDLFLPVFKRPESLEYYRLHVLDRWGRLCFQTDNPHQGWSGRDLPTGVYTYTIEYKHAGERSKLVSGSVTKL